MKKIISLLIITCTLTACKKDASFSNVSADIPPETNVNSQDELLHLNEIQIIASHNSYRQMTTPAIYNFLSIIGGLLPDDLDPAGLDYNHIPVDSQMSNYPVRGLELDVYYDPQGGAFAGRRMNYFVGLPENSGVPELDEPGFKVLHIKDVDYNTNYYTFKQALLAVKNWSDLHPNHLPLFINVETKLSSPADNTTLGWMGFEAPPPFTASAPDELDDEIKSVFGNDLEKVLTPDKLRGTYATLDEMALQKAWPKLSDCRGKIIFITEGSMTQLYKQGHPSLSGRAMFVYASPGTPEAAFVVMNEPVENHDQIKQLVTAGYIVRTRCDAETYEARSGDYSRMYAAFTSGAQINSTDYYRSDSRAGQNGWSNYHVSFPNGELARKNPVNATEINVRNALTE